MMRRSDVIIRRKTAFILLFALIGYGVNLPVMTAVAESDMEADGENFAEINIIGEQENQKDSEDLESGIVLCSVIDDVLKEDAEKYICKELKTKIEDVASGNRTNTIFTIDLGDASLAEWLHEDDAKGFSKVVHALLNDCSYDLFWFDRTQEYSLTYRGSTVTFTFPVARKYQSHSNCMTDANLIKQAKATESTAKDIVRKAASKNDRDKLKTYMQEICSLTSYNSAALSQKDDPNCDTDAWQAVNVFTGKQAVCEGYSKAFRYLCDSSEFSSDVHCYTVSGNMKGSGEIIGGGDHTWNIVVIDGKSYLADVTNCDALSSDALFLAVPKSGSVETGYVFKISGGTVTYTYDEDTLELFGKNSEILKLAAASSASMEQKPSTLILPKMDGRTPSLTLNLDED